MSKRRGSGRPDATASGCRVGDGELAHRSGAGRHRPDPRPGARGSPKSRLLTESVRPTSPPRGPPGRAGPGRGPRSGRSQTRCGARPSRVRLAGAGTGREDASCDGNHARYGPPAASRLGPRRRSPSRPRGVPAGGPHSGVNQSVADQVQAAQPHTLHGHSRLEVHRSFLGMTTGVCTELRELRTYLAGPAAGRRGRRSPTDRHRRHSGRGTRAGPRAATPLPGYGRAVRRGRARTRRLRHGGGATRQRDIYSRTGDFVRRPRRRRRTNHRGLTLPRGMIGDLRSAGDVRVRTHCGMWFIATRSRCVVLTCRFAAPRGSP